jgi:hypothetical protein
MKVPVHWLAEWVKVPWAAPELGARLTMAGFELETLSPAAPPFSGRIRRLTSCACAACRSGAGNP